MSIKVFFHPQTLFFVSTMCLIHGKLKSDTFTVGIPRISLKYSPGHSGSKYLKEYTLKYSWFAEGFIKAYGYESLEQVMSERISGKTALHWMATENALISLARLMISEWCTCSPIRDSWSLRKVHTESPWIVPGGCSIFALARKPWKLTTAEDIENPHVSDVLVELFGSKDEPGVVEDGFRLSKNPHYFVCFEGERVVSVGEKTPSSDLMSALKNPVLSEVQEVPARMSKSGHEMFYLTK